MNSITRNRTPVALTLSAVVTALLTIALWQPAQAQREGQLEGRMQPRPVAAGAAHYTVVATEGHNLIVTDNHSNTLYFYTIDKDKEVGSELKLRGSIDLNKVGHPEIKPTTHQKD